MSITGRNKIIAVLKNLQQLIITKDYWPSLPIGAFKLTFNDNETESKYAENWYRFIY